MTSSDIRQSFLDFFREKGHTIVPSSPLLPDSPNLLFTNAGMNQFVPIFLGQAPCPYNPARAADTQKCIRAGGKHNDLEDVGFDTYHHTFFEMLGNWSFGNYFKKEAIEWAWELVVKRWNFPASRIYATVYSPGPGDPAGFDREAHEHWSEIFIAAGLDPAVHVVHGNKKDNFWMMGDTGPCGPCSELHVDLTPGPRDLDIPRQIEGRNLVNSGDARCIEIWNLVFIQLNARVVEYREEGEGELKRKVPSKWEFDSLPACHVDTGMGFERVTSMIQGTKNLTDFSEAGKISNYETDVFRPIFDELEKITGKTYTSTLHSSAQNLTEQEKIDVAFRVIADHIRTLSFSIADGIQPSNEGRGYVLRRILRRAVKYGRNLGLREPFLGKLVDVLGKTMGHIFPEVVKQAELIKKTLTNEEESFLRTLERGIELFESVILSLSKDQPQDISRSSPASPASPTTLRHPEPVEGSVQPPSSEGQSDINRELILRQAQDDGIVKIKIFPGSEAFKLSDTYGFPLDLTELMARERGLTVDVAEFNRLMEEQKARGKAAQKKEAITVEDVSIFAELPATVFYGFDELQTSSIVVFKHDMAFVSAESPFYVEMGGQVGDTGTAEVNGKTFQIYSVIKAGPNRVICHQLGMDAPKDLVKDQRVILRVNAPRRARIEAHHSGTHIMHWALRKVLGNTVTQKGSYVGPDRLRFDFSHGAALTPAELAEVEKLVNEKIAENLPVTWEERPYAQVKGDPSILQFFGDKYGESVRVVSIGDFSKELCGGTHVRESGRIGWFRILHESAIAAGIRRIEAMSGDALKEHLDELIRKQDEQLALASEVAGASPAPMPSWRDDLPVVRGPAGAGPSNENLPSLWQRYKDNEKLLHELEIQRIQHEKDEAKRREASFQKQAAMDAISLIATTRAIGEIPFLTHQVTEMPGAYLPVLADALKSRWQGVAILTAVDQGKVSLLAAVAPAYTKKIQAGKIIQAIAPLVGGKGGGRPELAQGGGTNPEGLAAALAKAEELVRG